MKNSKKNYIVNYIDEFNLTISKVKSQKKEIEKIYKTLVKFQNKKNVHVFGNGGSASIASHFSMDLTNNSKIKCYSYNDPALITCYANDFKYENWISRVIQKYGNKDDLLILISSSGESKNMLNAVTAAKKMKFSKVVTFTGFNIDNSLKKKGDINIWINSKMYNVVENSHQFYLLLLVDMIKKFKK
jgi:D-sedoheptulose 7-phosphate isomerase